MVAFDGVQLLDVSGPLQVFASCNDLLRERGKSAAYAIHVVSRHGGLVASSAGLSIDTESLPAKRRRAFDTVLLPGGAGVHPAATDTVLIRWIRAAANRTGRIASVCTGAFLLGAAGLLDGRQVATHWQHATALAERFPDARVDPDAIFVEDGALWSSAGVTAGIDLALALVERDAGRELALAVARRLVVYLKRPGGQSQFSHALASQTGARFEELHTWMRHHLAADLSVSALASRAGMSERNFARRYKRETGHTPAVAVERLRIEHAQRLLEGGSTLVKAATACGYGSAETFNRAFARTLGLLPSEYRARFGDFAR